MKTDMYPNTSVWYAHGLQRNASANHVKNVKHQGQIKTELFQNQTEDIALERERLPIKLNLNAFEFDLFSATLKAVLGH